MQRGDKCICPTFLRCLDEEEASINLNVKNLCRRYSDDHVVALVGKGNNSIWCARKTHKCIALCTIVSQFFGLRLSQQLKEKDIFIHKVSRRKFSIKSPIFLWIGCVAEPKNVAKIEPLGHTFWYAWKGIIISCMLSTIFFFTRKFHLALSRI